MRALAKRLLIILSPIVISSMLFTGCSDTPTTRLLVDANDVGPLVALADGGLRYGERVTGVVWEVDAEGTRDPLPLADLDVSASIDRGLLGLALDEAGRTFAAWTAQDGRLTVGQIAPGSTRLVWRGPVVSDTNIGGRITFTPQNRILLGIGDLQDKTAVTNETTINGKLVTIDPDRGPDQQPNLVSSGWTDPTGLSYVNELLWAVDNGDIGRDRVGRVGENGFTGRPAEIDDTRPRGLTRYGEQELLVCLSSSGDLRRYLMNDVEAVPGRVLANDCTGDAVELNDSRVAYASTNGISITAN